MEPLPAEIRCLPDVTHGMVSSRTGTPTGSPAATLDRTQRILTGKQIIVDVKHGTTPKEAVSLCQTLMRLGYGPGGRHGISTLVVAGDLLSGGSYYSTPDRPACAKGP